ALAYWWGIDIRRALNAFTSVLIITCPCALSLSSPFTLGNVLRILSRNKIFMKNALAIEKMAGIKAVVFDKTGTLTNNNETRVEFSGGKLSDYELELIKSLVYHSSHPLSRKIYGNLKSIKAIPTEHFKETEGKGIEGWIDENFVKLGSRRYVLGSETGPDDGESDFRQASRVYVAVNGNLKGYFVVRNEYRTGLGALISHLKHRFKLFVVSGDNDTEKNFLKQYVAEENLVFHQQPADKLQFIKRLQREGEPVMMVGDGLNDAGALKQANVGLAISDNVNNFFPACDGIIEASKFELIPDLMAYARRSVNIIKASFGISLLYNLVGLSFAVQGNLSPLIAAVLMPISSVTIIVFTTLSSTLAMPKSMQR
ncbi:MAG TPA: HAD-IC family P-type ATPase, partial [Chitinophagales bacterium]|nr:HAD-IC family P-type ATPase [Chitinophagales bacterium]